MTGPIVNVQGQGAEIEDQGHVSETEGQCRAVETGTGAAGWYYSAYNIFRSNRYSMHEVGMNRVLHKLYQHYPAPKKRGLFLFLATPIFGPCRMDGSARHGG